MTKQKFPRDAVQQKWFEGNGCGTHTEQSWNPRADTQPLPLARMSPQRGQTTCTCAGTKDSIDKDLREPPAPISPPGQWFFSVPDGNIWVTWPEARPMLVDIHFPVPCLKAG